MNTSIYSKFNYQLLGIDFTKILAANLVFMGRLKPLLIFPAGRIDAMRILILYRVRVYYILSFPIDRYIYIDIYRNV